MVSSLFKIKFKFWLSFAVCHIHQSDHTVENDRSQWFCFILLTLDNFLSNLLDTLDNFLSDLLETLDNFFKQFV